MAKNGASNCEIIEKYFADITKYKPLKAEEERELARKIKEGDREALDKLVKANLKYVVNFTKRYISSGVPFLDLINEGNMGLIEAAKRFDPERGTKFITYAVWWIRDAINRCIAMFNCNDEVNVEEDRTYDTKGTKESASDDEYVNPSILDRIDEKFERDVNDLQEQKAAVNELMDCLQDRERKIIMMYYGIGNDGIGISLDEIGKSMNISKERVRQLKRTALIKLRTNAMMSDDFDTFKSLR